MNSNVMINEHNELEESEFIVGQTVSFLVSDFDEYEGEVVELLPNYRIRIKDDDGMVWTGYQDQVSAI